MLTARPRFHGLDYADLLCGFDCCGELLGSVWRSVSAKPDGTPFVTWELYVMNGYKERTPRLFFPGQHAARSYRRAPRRPPRRQTRSGLQLWDGARLRAQYADSSPMTEQLYPAHRFIAGIRFGAVLFDTRNWPPDVCQLYYPITIACWTHRHYSIVTFDQLESERAKLELGFAPFAPIGTYIATHN